MSDDIIETPKHYARYKIQPRRYCMENNFEYWRGSVIKYVSRAGFKDYEGKTPIESEILDLRKAEEFIKYRREALEEKL